MTTVHLKKFGLNLSGRAQGISAFKVICSQETPPFELDFESVFSIGSSFADEVVVPLAKLNNGNEMKISNPSVIVKKCLKDVEEEHGIKVVFV